MGDYGCMSRAHAALLSILCCAAMNAAPFYPYSANIFALSSGYREIPVHHAEREFGDSKYSFMRLINLMWRPGDCSGRPICRCAC